MRPLSSLASKEGTPKQIVGGEGQPSDHAKCNAMAPLTSVSQDAEHHALALLLAIEAGARNTARLEDLWLLMANESRKLTAARQIFVFSEYRIIAISGVPKVDRHAELVQDIEQLVLSEITRSDEVSGDEAILLDVNNYPFPHLLWHPLWDRHGKYLGGMLFARGTPWLSSDCTIVARLADAFSHVWQGFTSGQQTFLKGLALGLRNKMLWFGAILVTLMAMAIPMPMSSLAPMEIVAQKPYIVAAPIEATIQEFLVEPGSVVKQGDRLLRFNDVILRNKLDVAEREVQVAEAALKKASQLAFSSDDGHKQLRSAMADLELKKAQWQFASDLFAQTVLKAERDGVAIFADKQSLLGKPLRVGERIMQIADPAKVEIRIEVPVADALMLKPGAKVKLFLDSAPVAAEQAILRTSDYQAQKTAGDSLAFHAVADFVQQPEQLPRIGVRGTAQIYGEDSFLGMYLFRRPLSVLRQWIGL